MKSSFKVDRPYSVCVIDIGSPKLGNIGWCLKDAHSKKKCTGDDLDELFVHIDASTKMGGLIIGLEAPLFVPLRKDLILATKARKGEGRRPWSAGAGAQVLAMNLPIMIYLFKGIQSLCPDLHYFLNEENFLAKPKQVMMFEALVSGKDKGSSHIHDAEIMATSCYTESMKCLLPPSILEYEYETEFFNLAAAALLRCGILEDLNSLNVCSPIYKPSD
jgi:hypothetical protein